jgi:hypothetical protein
MAWTDPTQRSASDFLTAAIFNADVIDNLAYLLAAVEPNTLTNKSGSSVSAGTVVIADTGNNSAFDTTTTANSEDVLGVARETIANDAAGRVAVFGVASVLVQGNVARGDFLATSTTAGRAKSVGSSKTAGAFAVALTAYAGGGAGTVTALVLPGFAAGSAAANSVMYTTAGAAPTGWTEYTAGRGRVIVGLPGGGAAEGTVGSALSDQGTITHTHTIGTVIAHTHTINYGNAASGAPHANALISTTGFTESTSEDGNTGVTAGGDHTMPYIQLMTIRKS